MISSPGKFTFFYDDPIVNKSRQENKLKLKPVIPACAGFRYPISNAKYK